MPRAPSSLTWLPSARDDVASIQDHNPDHAERILRKVGEWEEWITLGVRVPQEQMEYLGGSSGCNFYRWWVGQSGYRLVFEISGDVMTVVAALPKDDDTYDIEQFERRMARESD